MLKELYDMVAFDPKDIAQIAEFRQNAKKSFISKIFSFV